MATNRTHWLEIAEYVAYGLTILSLTLAIATKALIYPLICLSLTLGLNLVNRLRWQYLHRKRLATLLKQSQKPDLYPAQPTTNLAALGIIQENLIALEKSLNGIVKYLNNNALKERTAQLEKSVIQLKGEILRDHPSNSLVLTPSPPSHSSTLPLVNLTPVPSPVAPESWQCLHSLMAHSQAIGAISISPEQRFLATAGWDHSLKIWDLARGDLLASVTAHAQGILGVVFCPQERYQLATGGFDQVIKIWSFFPAEGELKLSQVLKSHSGSIHGLAYLTPFSLLVSGSYDGDLKQWDLKREKVIANSWDELGAIYAIAVHPSSKWIASGGGDGTVTLWQSQTGKQIGTLAGNVSSVAAMAISPDGQTLAVGCVDGSVKLWHLDHLEHRQPLRSFIAHQGQVNALQFSQDSQILLSGGADGQINLWYPQSSTAHRVHEVGRRLADTFGSATLPMAANAPVAITAMALSQDGRYLVAGGMDGSIKIWLKD